MSDEPDKAKRWRPRFSVRTLVVLVTLVCVYLGLWEATEEFGATPLNSRVEPIELAGDDPAFWPPIPIHARSPAPLIVVVEEAFYPADLNVTRGGVHSLRHISTTHLWLFGPRFKLRSEVQFW